MERSSIQMIAKRLQAYKNNRYDRLILREVSSLKKTLTTWCDVVNITLPTIEHGVMLSSLTTEQIVLCLIMATCYDIMYDFFNDCDTTCQPDTNRRICDAFIKSQRFIFMRDNTIPFSQDFQQQLETYVATLINEDERKCMMTMTTDIAKMQTINEMQESIEKAPMIDLRLYNDCGKLGSHCVHLNQSPNELLRQVLNNDKFRRIATKNDALINIIAKKDHDLIIAVTSVQIPNDPGVVCELTPLLFGDVSNIRNKFKALKYTGIFKDILTGDLDKCMVNEIKMMYAYVFNVMDTTMVKDFSGLLILAHLYGINMIVIDPNLSKALYIRANACELAMCLMVSNTVFHGANETTNFDKLFISRNYMCEVILEEVLLNILFPGECIKAAERYVYKTPPVNKTLINIYDYVSSNLTQIQVEDIMRVVNKNWHTDAILHLHNDRLQRKNLVNAMRPQPYGNEFTNFNINAYAIKAVKMFNFDHPFDRYDIVEPQCMSSESYNNAVSYPRSYGGNVICNNRVLNNDRQLQSLFYCSMLKKLFLPGVKYYDNLVTIARVYISFDGTHRVLVSWYVSLSEHGRVKRVYATVTYIEKVAQMLVTSFCFAIHYDKDDVKSIQQISIHGPYDRSAIPNLLEMLNQRDTAFTTKLSDSITTLNVKIKDAVSILLLDNKHENRKNDIELGLIKVKFSNHIRRVKSKVYISLDLLHNHAPSVYEYKASNFSDWTFKIPLCVRDSMCLRINSNKLKLQDEITMCYSDLKHNILSYSMNCVAKQHMTIDRHDKTVTMPCGMIESIYNPMLHKHNCTIKIQGFEKVNNEAFAHNGHCCDCGLYYTSNILAKLCCTPLPN